MPSGKGWEIMYMESFHLHILHLWLKPWTWFSPVVLLRWLRDNVQTAMPPAWNKALFDIICLHLIAGAEWLKKNKISNTGQKMKSGTHAPIHTHTHTHTLQLHPDVRMLKKLLVICCLQIAQASEATNQSPEETSEWCYTAGVAVLQRGACFRVQICHSVCLSFWQGQFLTLTAALFFLFFFFFF